MKKKIIIHNYNNLIKIIYNKIANWNNQDIDIELKKRELLIIVDEIINTTIDYVFQNLINDSNNERQNQEPNF